MKEQKLLTNDFIIATTFILSAYWLMAEMRPHSAILMHTAGLVFFAKDIIKKFRNRRKK